MGNNPSRVAPVHSLKIFDSQTRARYKNQRESNQLRLRIRRLDVRENEVLSRLTYEQHDAKMKLHELQYDKAQRQLYKSIDTHRKKVHSPFFNVSHLDNQSSIGTTNLLLHQMNESSANDKINSIRNKQNSALNKAKSSNTVENFQSEYSPKVNINQKPSEHTEKYLVTHARSLQRETEQMKKSIKIAVAKAARDSNIVARRDAHYH